MLLKVIAVVYASLLCLLNFYTGEQTNGPHSIF